MRHECQAGPAELHVLRGEEAEVRCGCGSLLARLVGTTLELKCRRCKRSWRIPVRTD